MKRGFDPFQDMVEQGVLSMAGSDKSSNEADSPKERAATGGRFKGLLSKNLAKKFGQEMIDANFAAVNRAYEEVTVA